MLSLGVYYLILLLLLYLCYYIRIALYAELQTTTHASYFLGNCIPMLCALADPEVWNKGRKGGGGVPLCKNFFENFMQKSFILVQNFHLFQDASSQWGGAPPPPPSHSTKSELDPRVHEFKIGLVKPRATLDVRK